VKSVIFKGVFC